MNKIIAALLPAFAVLSLSAGVASAQFVQMEPPRQVLFDGNIYDPTGKPVSLVSVLSGRPAIVHFWAMWCAPCREELPELASFRETLETDSLSGLLVVVAAERGGAEGVARFLNEKLGLSGFATYLDPSGTAGRAFALFGMPSTFLVNAEGRVVEIASGPVRWNDADVREKLRKHLAD